MIDDALDDALGATLREALGLIEAGATDPHSPFHTLTLGTVGQSGPRLRSVILRGFDRDALRLEIHTDARSPKVAELEAEPAVELLVWDAQSRRQLRLSGLARLHDEGARVETAWQALGEHSRATYRVGAAPSTPLGEAEQPPPDQDEAAARAAFLVIEVTLSAVEYLRLSPEGNRRALFRLQGAITDIEACWLVP